jgi:hypothetical protein
MAITATTVVEPFVAGPGIRMAVYQILWDTSYPTGGEELPANIVADFTYIYGITEAGNDTLADNQYRFGAILPTSTTAVTAANTLLTVHWGGTTDAAMEEFTNTGSLAAVGQTTIVVIGA